MRWRMLSRSRSPASASAAWLRASICLARSRQLTSASSLGARATLWQGLGHADGLWNSGPDAEVGAAFVARRFVQGDCLRLKGAGDQGHPGVAKTGGLRLEGAEDDAAESVAACVGDCVHPLDFIHPWLAFHRLEAAAGHRSAVEVHHHERAPGWREAQAIKL